jgi:hypothetical protein
MGNDLCSCRLTNRSGDKGFSIVPDLVFFFRFAAYKRPIEWRTVELSTRQHFALWLPLEIVLSAWSIHRPSSDAVEGLSLIDGAIDNYRQTGSIPTFPF